MEFKPYTPEILDLAWRDNDLETLRSVGNLFSFVANLSFGSNDFVLKDSELIVIVIEERRKSKSVF